MECFLEDHSYNELTRQIEHDITGKHKCSVIGVMDNPPFSYSIGLTDHGWPELIVAGIDPRVAVTMINNLVMRFETEGVPEPSDEIDKIVTDFPVRLQPISDAQLEQYMVQALERQKRVGGPRPQALQVIFPDLHGRWPDDPNCDAVCVAAEALLTDEQKERVQ